MIFTQISEDLFSFDSQEPFKSQGSRSIPYVKRYFWQ